VLDSTLIQFAARVHFRYNRDLPRARRRADVAELADALDLGSSALRAWRFESSRRHQVND
jgi:hypothetical protein